MAVLRNIKDGAKVALGLAETRERREDIQNLEPPVLYDDPLEALHWLRGGKPAAFHCPLEKCVRHNGLSFAREGWHHFAETAIEYLEGASTTYEGSILERYYRSWQPENASQAVAGFRFEGSSLRNFPPYAILCCHPWDSHTIEDAVANVRRWVPLENEEHGETNLTVENSGTKYYGPVAPRKGILEFRRMARVARSIRSSGYDRFHGDVQVTLLRRGSDYRYLKKGAGYHRTAVMAALGCEAIPAVFNAAFAVDVRDVTYWPQVRRGVWDRKDAIRYFNHLFDFDSRAWAQERGLLPR